MERVLAAAASRSAEIWRASTGQQLALAHASVGLGQDGDDDAFTQRGYIHLVFDHDGA